MRVATATFIFLFITIVIAFVPQNFLRTIDPPLAFSPLYIENVNLNAVDKTLEKTPSVSSEPAGSSHTRFLDYPRSQYVDKTLFIRDVLQFYSTAAWFGGNPVSIITRPRGFGKTLTLSSLYYFCDYTFKNATALFSGLKIMEKDQLLDAVRQDYMSKLPVIWIDFGTVKYETFEENFKEIKRIVIDVYRTHDYVLASMPDSFEKEDFQTLLLGKVKECDIIHSISALCHIINKHNKDDYNKKPIILIDNYDVPFHTGYKYNFLPKIERFMFGFYGDVTRRGFAHKIIFAGVTQVGQNAVLWGQIFESVRSSIVLDASLSEHFGFTSEDIEGLIRQSRKDVNLQMLRDQYGGYSCGNMSVYNPLSIIGEIFSNKPHQWAELESKEQLGKLIVEHGFYPLLTLQQVLGGEHVEKILAVDVDFLNMRKIEVSYWSYLAHSGYLTATKASKEEKGVGLLRIPNSEVRNRIESLLKEYSKSIPLYSEFTNLLISGDHLKTRVFFLEYIQRSGEYFREECQDYNAEKLRVYLKQMLRGVETIYNTTMKITEKNNAVTMEIAANKGEGKLVTVTLQNVDTSEKSRDYLKRELCSENLTSHRGKPEVIIMFEKKFVDVCVNFIPE